MVTGTVRRGTALASLLMAANKAARWQFAAVLSALCLSLMAWAPAADSLMWDRGALGHGQFWRGMTAHLVHLNMMHCLKNLLGLLLICEYLWHELRLFDVCVLTLWTAAGVSLMLWWLVPDVGWYLGLSGVLHGLWAGSALVWLLRAGALVPAVALALLVIKLSMPVAAVGALPVVSVAHGYGALCGVLWAVLRTCVRRREFFG